MELLRDKHWIIPTANKRGVVSKNKVNQEVFFSEYFPTSHKIFSREYYSDINIVDENDKLIDIHLVNRISVPFQSMSVDIILAHLLGNKTYLSDSASSDNPSLHAYREYWDNKNVDTAIYSLLKSVLSLGDGALLFYRDSSGKLKYQALSMFDGDEFYMEYDKHREPVRFYNYYGDKCDVYDNQHVKTYLIATATDDTPKLISTEVHGFKGLPVSYKKRQFGAFWTPVQANIDNIELMLSRVSEDNRAKFKSLYHLSTDNPDDVETTKAGTMDMVVTDKNGEFKLIPPAEISSQFKFEYDALKELIFDALGIVFPKHKSSGDMPTGSMKMMFYPTERIVKSLITEFDSTIDEINEIVKQGFIVENPDSTMDILNGNIRASIRLFTPQDEVARNENLATLLDKGVISQETAAEECSVAANNEMDRKKREKEEEVGIERARANIRLPFSE